MALTDLTYVKNVMQIPASDISQDSFLQAYIDAADVEIKRYCDRDFESATYTHYFSGSNTPRLALRQYPVTAITSVKLDNGGYYGQASGHFGSESLLTEGVDYVLDRDLSDGTSKSGVLFRIGTVWPMMNRIVTLNRLSPDLGPAWGNIKVVYIAGYTTIPKDLQIAVAMVAAAMKRYTPSGGIGIKHEKIGDYSYDLFNKVLYSIELGTVRTILARYHNYTF